jgi:DNA-binding transcriptional regulator YhcF (GntR family)
MRAAPAKPSQSFQFQLDLQSGVPVYRQIIDQVLGGISAGNLKPGDQLPTVRQLAVDLSINPNTVVRAYRELEIREILSTQQGTGTFITEKTVKTNEIEHQRQLAQLANDFLARAGAAGITLQELLDYLSELKTDRDRRV